MRQILEIGTGDGRTTTALAQGLPPSARVITMEADARRAAEARRRFAQAGLGDRITVVIGAPVRFLHKLRGPFDAIYVNLAQPDAPPRARLAALLAPGGLLIERGAGSNDTILVNDMTIAEWLAQAKADVERRGLPELIPMLEGLAQATERLRAADWNDTPDTDTPHDEDQ